MPRYLTDLPLPKRAYLPGTMPHPSTRPQQDAREPSSPLEAGQWQASRGFLWGVDLYNEGFFWEAHEAWEELWKQAARPSPTRSLLQGLIQCAAAALKMRCEQPRGAASLASTAIEHLHAAKQAAGSPYCGIDLDSWITDFSHWAAAGPAPAADRPRLTLLL